MSKHKGSLDARRVQSAKTKKFGLKLFSLATAVLALSAMVGITCVHAAPKSKVLQPSPPVSAQASKDVTYPTSLFEDGKAHHFQYRTEDGVNIRYFVIKSSDGVIRAAFDTCVVCWREGKGYVQKDDTMICTNCGRRFKSTKINEVTGGCNPAPLLRSTEGGKVIIKAESLLQGKILFAGGR